MENKAGIGSFFHKVESNNIKDFNLDKYITNYKLFYTGRHAIKYIIDEISLTKNISKIWLPNYYCQHVTSWLMACYDNIHLYDIDPFFSEENLNIDNFSSKEDVVILNNFWGIYNYTLSTSNSKPTYIEDHSHGWQTKSCLNSKADYCIASLRKTLPIPLGAILWQPKTDKEYNIKLTKNEKFYNNWEKVKLAMLLKKDNIEGKEKVDNKATYLKIINESEQYLHQQHTPVLLREEDELLIKSYLNKDYYSYKKNNLDFLIKNLSIPNNFKILNSKLGSTFGLQLVFKDKNTLNKVKETLITNAIYPSELWPNNEERRNWSFLLNIHIDFRYNLDNMNHILNTINTII